MTKVTSKKDNNLEAYGLLFSVVSADADTLWVVKDPSGMMMHAFVNDNDYVQVSHPNMVAYLKGAGHNLGTVIPSTAPILCAVIKAWPSRTVAAKLRPLSLAEAMVEIDKLNTINKEQGIAILEESPSQARFGKKRVYDSAGAWLRLENNKHDNEVADFESPLLSDKLLLDTILAGDTCKRVLNYVESELGGTPYKNILLHGAPGAGKTTIAQAVSAHLNLPYAMQAVHDTIDADAFGGYIASSPINGQVNFIQIFTKFLIVAVCGGVTVWDEADVLPIGIQKMLNNFLWGDGHITFKGKDYYRHPDTIVFLTCNTGLAGDQPFLNAFETRLRPFLVPALTLEERARYWHKLFDGKVTTDYLETYILLCDALVNGLKAEDIANDDDRHPDGTAFSSRGHLTMLSEWLQVKDSADMTEFVTQYMRDFIGNINNAEGHLATLMDGVADKILKLESMAAVSFIEAADTDEGIDDAQFQNIMQFLNASVTKAETVAVKSDKDFVSFTFSGGRFGSESIARYSYADIQVIPISGVLVSDTSVFDAAAAVIHDLMTRGVTDGIHDVNTIGQPEPVSEPEPLDSLASAAQALRDLF